jgi:regulator of protease activity HflC (stomatin/prohibitin superfamily)
MNTVVTYRVADARTAVSTVDDVRQALYREAQLALRAVVGAGELDTFLQQYSTMSHDDVTAGCRSMNALRP